MAKSVKFDNMASWARDCRRVKYRGFISKEDENGRSF